MNCALCPRLVTGDQHLCLPCIRDEGRKHKLPHGRLGRVYPFAEFKVGEERVIDAPRYNVAPAACQFGRRHGMRFSTHKLDGDRCCLTRIA